MAAEIRSWTAILSCAGFLMMSSAFAGCGRSGGAVGPGDSAPDIELQDLAGGMARVTEYQGSVVLLDFWATYCEACHDSIPAFQRLQETYGAQGFDVMGVSIDTYAGGVGEYVREKGMKYRVLLDPKLEMARAYGVRGLPAAFLVGRDGNILRKWVGYDATIAAEIESEVKAALL